MTKSSKPRSDKTSPFSSAPARDDGELRIIGGRWRGRKLRFPSLPGLRPSPDRVRETLFNWLAPELPGARCLDLFAGSGALGLEALSRGAALCTFVDSARAACARIDAHLTLLDCADGRVHNADVAQWLQSAPADSVRYDIVFLDPPFRQDLLGACCERLEHDGWLTPHAWIYMEAGTDEALPPLPPSWRLHRDKRAGQVAYRLFVRDVIAADDKA